jgi:hypothetical protein
MRRASLILTLICPPAFLIPHTGSTYQNDSQSCGEEFGQTIMVDPAETDFIDWPQSIHMEEERDTLPLSQLRRVGRMSEGILFNWVEKRNQGVWFECGLRYETKEEKKEAATLWAYQIIRSAQQHNINPWGLAGTIANESNFDRCAVGYHPRIWAQKKHMLKRKRRTISYSAEEVVAVYRSIAAKRRWRHTGWDVGPCQMLSKFYPGNIEDMFSLVPGIDICAMEMRARADMYRTDRGWRWWRGAETAWYDARVTRFARLMGATAEEI